MTAEPDTCRVSFVRPVGRGVVVVTREQAIDVLYSAMMTMLPVGAGQPNTDADRLDAKRITAAFLLALETIGVTIDELEAAERRWVIRIG